MFQQTLKPEKSKNQNYYSESKPNLLNNAEKHKGHLMVSMPSVPAQLMAEEEEEEETLQTRKP